MGFRISGVIQAKRVLRRSLSGSRESSSTDHIPKVYFALYVGDNQRRYVAPVGYLSQPAFQELLIQAEEEYGFEHPNGGLNSQFHAVKKHLIS